MDDFYVLRWNIVPTMNWRREMCPKIVLYFDNPKTQGGAPEPGVFVKYSILLHEIDLLSGVPKGFIEINNYKAQVLEILSPREGDYILIRERDDTKREPIDKANLVQNLHTFLVNGY